jgi:hypothetical protein
MSSFRKNANRNVSSTGLSGAERKEISLLLVVPDKKSGHGNAGAAVWSYYGKLCYRDNSSTTVLDVDDNHRYCRLCLEREQELYRNSPATGHISRVTKYGKMTATGSLANHLFINHNVDVRNEQASTSAATVRRQLSIQQSLFAGKDRESKPAETQFELSRDLCRMMCVDLMPFSTVSGRGFIAFCRKNLPSMTLPDESTLSRGALYDLYCALKVSVKTDIQKALTDGGCLCLMFDGWTDRYHGRPYLGLRVAFVNPETWMAEVKTISVKVVSSHTGEELANHIRTELDDFGIQRDATIYSTHDGAKNMMKCSRLLEVEGITHCVAHSIHLLLTVDTLNKNTDATDLITKCKNIVTRLHFKGGILADEAAKLTDRIVMVDLLAKIEAAKLVLDADEQVALLPADDDDDKQTGETHHRHTTLKQEVPTR